MTHWVMAVWSYSLRWIVGEFCLGLLNFPWFGQRFFVSSKELRVLEAKKAGRQFSLLLPLLLQIQSLSLIPALQWTNCCIFPFLSAPSPVGSCGSSPKVFVTTTSPIHLSYLLQASPGNMAATPDSEAGGQSSLSPLSSTSSPSLITQITCCSLSSLSAPSPGVYLNLVAHPAFLSPVESLSNTPPCI